MGVLNKIFFQTLWQVLARVVSAAVTALVLSMVARAYHEDGVGAYTLTTTYLTMFFIIVDLGLNAYILPRLSNTLSEANKLFNLRFYWSIVLVILANLILLIFPLGNEIFRYSVILGSGMLILVGIYNSTNLIFQYKLKYQLSAIASITGSLALLPPILLFIYQGFGVEYLILGSLFAWLVNNLVCLTIVSRFYKFRLTWPNFKFGFDTIKTAWPVSLTLIFNVIYFRMDSFVLSATRSIGEVGIYNLAFSLFQTALVLPTFIMNSYYPIVLRELSEKKKLLRQIKLGFLLMIGLGVFGTLMTFLLGPFLISVLTGGGFEGSKTSLNILSLGFPAFFGSAFLMWILVSLKSYKSLVIIYALGLVVNITLNLLLTPKYSYLASSWVTVSSEYLILFMEIVVLPQVLKKLK